MPYPRHLIQEGETVALDLRPHWWYFSRNILTGLPLAVVLVVVISERKHLGWAHDVVIYPLIAAVLIWAGWLTLKYFQWTMTHFVVTSRRVIYRTGVLSKKGVEIPLERVNNINFAQSIWDRIIGAGNLDIESAGKDGQSHFDFIRHPDGVQNEIYRQMEGRNMPAPAVAPAVPASPAGPSQSVPDQIEQLAQLRDRGHITPEEYERKKAQLLERM